LPSSGLCKILHDWLASVQLSVNLAHIMALGAGRVMAIPSEKLTSLTQRRRGAEERREERRRERERRRKRVNATLCAFSVSLRLCVKHAGRSVKDPALAAHHIR
ncbi:MAG: hypothetical protein KDE45_12215, partial [Caldilineaceae bacterium]|nr:hypothetical protein [Caldilineaceae bacterium]